MERERESDEEILIREKIPSPPRSSSDVLDDTGNDSRPEHVKAMFSAWQNAIDNGSLPKSLKESMSTKKMSLGSQSSIASTQSEKILGTYFFIGFHTHSNLFKIKSQHSSNA